MSRQYKRGSEVPTEVICKRLKELSNAVTEGGDSINREFYMRVPAEVDNDADLVLAEAKGRLKEAMQLLDCIMNDLPSNKDWLCPDIERRAKALIAPDNTQPTQ